MTRNDCENRSQANLLPESPEITQAPAIESRGPDFNPDGAFSSLTSDFVSDANGVISDITSVLFSLASDFGLRSSSIEDAITTATGAAAASLASDLISLQSSFSSAIAALANPTGTGVSVAAGNSSAPFTVTSSTPSSAAGFAHTTAIGVRALFGGMVIMVSL